MKPRSSNAWKVFGIPSLIALLSATGLFAALLGDGAWDTLSWLGLAACISLSGLLPRKG